MKSETNLPTPASSHHAFGPCGVNFVAAGAATVLGAPAGRFSAVSGWFNTFSPVNADTDVQMYMLSMHTSV